MIRKIKSKTGTGEWCTHEADVGVGCENNCRYCYAACTAHRFRDSWGMPRDQWHNYRHRLDWVEKILNSRLNGATVMFPTKHDFNCHNWQDAAKCIKHMINSGNRVLMVTKGGKWADSVITWLVENDYLRNPTEFELRVTITGFFATCKFWEPGASRTERLDTLHEANDRSIRTSVSCEPLLEAETICDRHDIIRLSLHSCTGDVWVGKLRNLNQRVDLSKVTNGQHARYIAPLIEMQTDENILRLVDAFKNEPRVKWKDSIREVIERNKPSSR